MERLRNLAMVFLGYEAPRPKRMSPIVGAALAAIIATAPAAAHMPAECVGIAVERRAEQGAHIAALESLAEFVRVRAPMHVIDQALLAVTGTLVDFGDADLRLVECMVDAE